MGRYLAYFLLALIPALVAWILAPLYKNSDVSGDSNYYRLPPDEVEYDLSVVIPCYNEEER